MVQLENVSDKYGLDAVCPDWKNDRFLNFALSMISNECRHTQVSFRQRVRNVRAYFQRPEVTNALQNCDTSSARLAKRLIIPLLRGRHFALALWLYDFLIIHRSPVMEELSVIRRKVLDLKKGD